MGAISAVALGAVLLGCSALTLGWPDLRLAGQFLGGAYPSMASAVAFLSLLCYAVALGAVAVVVVSALRTVGRGRAVRSRTVRATACVLVGVILLSISVVGRIDTARTICCGGGARHIQEAASLAR